MAQENTFGEKARARREELEMTLRDFAEAAKQDPGNWSRVERGKLPPPKDLDSLELICNVLRYERNSVERMEFMDEAAIANGRIPQDVLGNAELLAELPLLFRKLRIHNVDQPEQLDALKSLLRNS